MPRSGRRRRVRTYAGYDVAFPIFERQHLELQANEHSGPGPKRRSRRLLACAVAATGAALAVPAAAHAGATGELFSTGEGEAGRVLRLSFERAEIDCRPVTKIARPPATGVIRGDVFVNDTPLLNQAGVQVFDDQNPEPNRPGPRVPCENFLGVQAFGTPGGDTFSIRPRTTGPHFPSLNMAIEGGAGNDVLDLGDVEFGPNDEFVFRGLDGGEGNDTILGSAGADTIIGGEGNDSLAGGGGDDFLGGHPGDDTIQGGAGNDDIHGGFSDDRIDPGDDVISGGTGDDTLDGGAGSDSIMGEAGNDTLFAGPGDDSLLGGGGNDSLVGGSGRNELIGGSGKDVLGPAKPGVDSLESYRGGKGADTLRFGSTGTYVLRGDKGRDTFVPTPDTTEIEGNVQIFGGKGADFADWSGLNTTGVTIDAGAGADTVRAGNADDVIRGGGGIDVLDGGGGRDIIIGGPRGDRIVGGGGNDILVGEKGNDQLDGGDEDDYLYGGLGIDLLLGGLGRDRADGGPGRRDACDAEVEVRCEREPDVDEVILRPGLIARALEVHGVSFVVIGGAAAVAQGARTTTKDIDITPAPDPGNLERIAAALRNLGARVRVPEVPGVPRVPEGLRFPFERAAELPTSYTWNLLTPAGRLDLLFRPSGVSGFDELRERARPVEIGGVGATVATLEDVIRIKAAAGRGKDIRALPALYDALDESGRRAPRRYSI